MERLKQRADFLAAAAGVRAPASAFVLQARARGDDAPARFGFTVSKKVGNAVERNRVRRRLREVVRLYADASSSAVAGAASAVAGTAASSVVAGHDFVLVGRRAALETPFERIVADFAGALKRTARRGRTESTQ